MIFLTPVLLPSQLFSGFKFLSYRLLLAQEIIKKYLVEKQVLKL